MKGESFARLLLIPQSTQWPEINQPESGFGEKSLHNLWKKLTNDPLATLDRFASQSYGGCGVGRLGCFAAYQLSFGDADPRQGF